MEAPSERSFPGPKTSQCAAMIQGVRTEICLQEYADRYFILITQLDKLGTLVDATSQRGVNGELTFDAKVLQGKRDDPLLLIYARQLLEHISGAHNGDTMKSLLLAIALKDRSPTAFEQIINQVLEHKIW